MHQNEWRDTIAVAFINAYLGQIRRGVPKPLRERALVFRGYLHIGAEDRDAKVSVKDDRFELLAKPQGPAMILVHFDCSHFDYGEEELVQETASQIGLRLGQLVCQILVGKSFGESLLNRDERVYERCQFEVDDFLDAAGINRSSDTRKLLESLHPLDRAELLALKMQSNIGQTDSEEVMRTERFELAVRWLGRVRST